MELTPAEARLINTLREIDRANPLGIDAFTEAGILPALQRIADGQAAEAGRRYRLFIQQSKGQAFIDLRETQRSKTQENDPRPAPSIWA